MPESGFPMVKGFEKAFVSRKKSSKSSSLRPAIDCEQLQKQLAQHFEELKDPRGSQGVLHPFMSIVTIALLATIGGAKGWEDIEIYDYFRIAIQLPIPTKP